MKRAIFAIPALLILVALVLFGCGKQPGGSGNTGPSVPAGTVQMTGDNFVQHSVTISAGQAVHFDDSNGGLHIICLGHNQVCDKSAQGPQEVMGNGFTINPGEKKDVVFATAGTYQITCSVHPDMNLTVTVQ